MPSFPSEPYDIFLSYAREDKEKASQLADALSSHGWSVWWDDSIPIGSQFNPRIHKALETSRCVLVLWSKASVASDWVFAEASEAKRLDKLIPALIEEVTIRVPFNVIQTANLTGWRLEPTDPDFSKLLISLPALPDPPGSKPITTTTCLLHQEGGSWSVVSSSIQVEGYREELAEGVALTMVKIPAGSFLMGSPPDEPKRETKEGPQHKVTLGAFFLGQTPITQTQWQVVAGWEQVEHALEPDPSKFKGANRPVEQVSWIDAMEFCRRLSQRTRKSYGLPSEAQWEYACRAGTITPFHFGETLTPELVANYDGSYTYDRGPQGIDREQTSDVGEFPANAWGLKDMHGNVWEWCEDHWHASYDFAHQDDKSWLIPSAGPQERRVLRGGSWDDYPWDCRSACRYCYLPGFRSYCFGFRVYCLPPGLSS